MQANSSRNEQYRGMHTTNRRNRSWKKLLVKKVQL
jgi:hypothetical protein